MRRFVLSNLVAVSALLKQSSFVLRISGSLLFVKAVGLSRCFLFEPSRLPKNPQILLLSNRVSVILRIERPLLALEVYALLPDLRTGPSLIEPCGELCGTTGALAVSGIATVSSALL